MVRAVTILDPVLAPRETPVPHFIFSWERRRSLDLCKVGTPWDETSPLLPDFVVLWIQDAKESSTDAVDWRHSYTHHIEQLQSPYAWWCHGVHASVLQLYPGILNTSLRETRIPWPIGIKLRSIPRSPVRRRICSSPARTHNGGDKQLVRAADHPA
jgi:hypothetical protein